MIFNESFEINLKINDKDSDLYPLSYSFYMEDNIHKLFPTCKIFLDDNTGFNQEFLLTTEGLKYSIDFGLKNDFIKNNYVIKNDSLPQNKTVGSLNGDVTIDLIHEYYDTQSKVSAIFNDRISNIIRDKISSYLFFDTNINDTGNQGIWIQPKITDSDFIINYLMPFVYSRNSNNSPFYCFIDSNNVFNLRNYSDMFNENPIADLILTGNQEQSFSINSIQAIKRIRKGSTYTKKYRHRDIYRFDETTGDLEISEDFIYSYPDGFKTLPMKANIDNITDYMLLYDEEETTGDKENNLGYKINSTIDGFGLEKFYITVPLNTNLLAGKVVTISLPDVTDNKKDSSSLYYTGKYLIESSVQVWSKNSTMGNTILVVSRKSIDIPEDIYLLKKDLVNG